MTHLPQRIHRLEAQRRPAHIATILWRVRACAPADLRACLLAELTAVDRATYEAIMSQLPETALEVLIGPEAGRFMDTLPYPALEALARGTPAATQQFQRAYAHWRKDTHEALTT